MSLRDMLNAGSFVSAPGVYDPLSARVAEQCGASVLYMSGYSVSASLLGRPDAGLISYREMVDRVRVICEVTSSPLIADGDTGFGGLANVAQAIAGYEAAGADAIQLEDQVFPKRCGHTRNRQVVSTAEMSDKIKVAVESRASDDMLVIARTDARTEHGLDEALQRGQAYLEAGADILFIESPESEAEMRTICEAFKGVPQIANMVAGGRTPVLPDDALKALGYQVVIHPVYLLGAAVSGMRTAMAELQKGKEQAVDDLNALNELVGFEDIWALDDRFSNME